MAAAVGHQVFVAVCWRLELHLGLLRRRLGASGLRLYAAGFAVWFALRFFTLISLAQSLRTRRRRELSGIFSSATSGSSRLATPPRLRASTAVAVTGL